MTCIFCTAIMLWAVALFKNLFKTQRTRSAKDLIVISGATGGVGQELLSRYKDQTVITLSRSAIAGDEYNLVVDYNDLSTFSLIFEEFLLQKGLSIENITEYHSLHGYGCIEAFEVLDTAFIDSYL